MFMTNIWFGEFILYLLKVNIRVVRGEILTLNAQIVLISLAKSESDLYL